MKFFILLLFTFSSLLIYSQNDSILFIKCSNLKDVDLNRKEVNKINYIDFYDVNCGYKIYKFTVMFINDKKVISALNTTSKLNDKSIEIFSNANKIHIVSIFAIDDKGKEIPRGGFTINIID